MTQNRRKLLTLVSAALILAPITAVKAGGWSGGKSDRKNGLDRTDPRSPKSGSRKR